MSIETLIEDFSFLDEWEDRYRYVIELGKGLEPLSEAEHDPRYKVQGCASQVWLIAEPDSSATPVRLHLRGDSDAHIVRGLIAILLEIYSDKTPEEILSIDALALMRKLGLEEHLSPQRSNGLVAMINRIRQHAQALSSTASH